MRRETSALRLKTLTPGVRVSILLILPGQAKETSDFGPPQFWGSPIPHGLPATSTRKSPLRGSQAALLLPRRQRQGLAEAHSGLTEVKKMLPHLSVHFLCRCCGNMGANQIEGAAIDARYNPSSLFDQ